MSPLAREEVRLRGRVLSVGVALVVSFGAACANGALGPPPLADIVSVRAEGEAGAYRFEVGIESPDLGCHQYADFWEVVSLEGELIHRRVLGHSHVNEQPFVRAGGPVPVDADTTVRVRAHLHPTGYGGQVWEGSVGEGFEPLEGLPADFAADLARAEPQPPACAH